MAAKQISFIDDSGLLRPDCICRFEIFCAFCGGVLPSRKRTKVLYWLAGRPPRRICRDCSRLYVKSFDERIVKAERGVKV